MIRPPTSNQRVGVKTAFGGGLAPRLVGKEFAGLIIISKLLMNSRRRRCDIPRYGDPRNQPDNPIGSVLYAAGSGNDAVAEYSLGAPFDLQAPSLPAQGNWGRPGDARFIGETHGTGGPSPIRSGG